MVVLVLANLTPESRNICLLVLCLNSFGSVISVSTAVKFSVVFWCFSVAGFGMCRSQDCAIYPRVGSSFSLCISKVSSQARQKSLFFFFFGQFSCTGF